LRADDVISPGTLVFAGSCQFSPLSRPFFFPICSPQTDTLFRDFAEPEKSAAEGNARWRRDHHFCCAAYGKSSSRAEAGGAGCAAAFACGTARQPAECSAWRMPITHASLPRISHRRLVCRRVAAPYACHSCRRRRYSGKQRDVAAGAAERVNASRLQSSRRSSQRAERACHALPKPLKQAATDAALLRR